jgi:hypothetical protein
VRKVPGLRALASGSSSLAGRVRALGRKRLLVVGVVVGLLAAGAVAVGAGSDSDDPKPVADPKAEAVIELGTEDDELGTPEIETDADLERLATGKNGKGASASGGDRPASGAQSDAEARRELAQLNKKLPGGAYGARLDLIDGALQAKAPVDAPEVVRKIIHTGNAISRAPYKWGGGHGRWSDSGYDCSGSVSFALAAGGLVKRSMASGGYMKWGKPGPGKWITIFTNSGHIYMVVAGLRFDTSGRDSSTGGSRWQTDQRSNAGFVVRHPPGL